MVLLTPLRIRAAAVFATVLVMLVHYFLPPRLLVIHPAPSNAYTIYSDGEWGGESAATWLDESKTQWRCTLKRSPAHPVCGLSVHWNDTDKKIINASGYSSLRLKLHYQGPGHTLRVYMRNFDDQHGTLGDRDTHKFMYVNIPTADFKGAIEIVLTELQVADWWKDEYKVDRNNAKPEFDRITSLGIDFPFPQVMGEHTLILERAELVGTWLPAEQLYLGIILAWLAALFLETLWHMYRWRKVARDNLRQVKDLTDYAQALRVTSEKYRELSHIDSLTEVYNRYGFMQSLKQLFGRGALSGCLIIIDIDHFKGINDTYGHVMGDNILRRAALLLASNIRKNDVFARWGGEEFVLLVTHYDLAQAQALAEKLRVLVEQHVFDEGLNIKITVSIGLTSFSKTDSLNSAFIRSDEALYLAKTQGRNQVVAATH